MRRLRRSKKASISILILLIFLLLAWMGALTFPFKTVMKTEQLQIVGVDFNGYGGPGSTIDIHVRNTGSATAIITGVKVDDAIIGVTDIIIDPGESYEITGIYYGWISETAYNIAVVTNTGATFTYRAIPPSP